MFSDIEGSTARWEANRDAMQAALRQHDAILHRAVAECGGRVFKTVGDQFCCVFTSAKESVAAAIAVAHRLRDEDFTPVDGIRVRIAIHAGECEERDGDYFGPTVNRVARLLAAGHGGQILLSERVYTTIAQALPTDAQLVDMGWHRLKDLTEPEHIFQLVATGLESEFPPLQSLTVTANNLPQQATSFVGREEDLAAIEDALRQGRLVSIVGVGGVGKTRIALAAAADALQSFRDGAWFVTFAPVTDAALAASTTLSALGISERPGAPALETLLDYCASRSLLLVLDNCEHVIDEAARIAEALLARAPGVKIITTTREPLNIAGEHAYRLPTLSIVEATQLFIERAKAADSTFQASAHEIPAIVDICERLDGIPLAIELAAPRVKTISVADISTRLDERFRLLRGGARTALPRQQTMHALIDWSYDLLSDSEKRLFYRLGIFAGSFSYHAALTVCADNSGDEYTVLNDLGALVDKSLVTKYAHLDGSRYRLLQSIQAYARERIRESGETAVLAQQHAQYFTHFTATSFDEWDAGAGANWLENTGAEIDNVRTAIAWAFSTEHDETGAEIVANSYPLFLRLSLLSEGISLCNTALAREPAPPIAARIQYGLSMLYNNQASVGAALAAAEKAVDYFRGSIDVRFLARSLSQYAWQLRQGDRFQEAAAAASEAVATARTLNDDVLLAATLQRCALSLSPEEIDAARSQFEEAVAVFRSRSLHTDAARALTWWAMAEGAAGCFERALELSLQALDVAGEDAKIFIEFNLSGYALMAGRSDMAREHGKSALLLARSTAHPVVFPLAISFLGMCVLDKDPAIAAKLLAFTRAQFDAADWPPHAHVDPELYRRFEKRLAAALPTEARQKYSLEGAAWDGETAFAQAMSV